MEIIIVSEQNENIPHGHGLSFKKGVSDALLNVTIHEDDLPNGHEQSYQRGKNLGEQLKEKIAELVLD